MTAPTREHRAAAAARAEEARVALQRLEDLQAQVAILIVAQRATYTEALAAVQRLEAASP